MTGLLCNSCNMCNFLINFAKNLISLDFYFCSMINLFIVSVQIIWSLVTPCSNIERVLYPNCQVENCQVWECYDPDKEK